MRDASLVEPPLTEPNRLVKRPATGAGLGFDCVVLVMTVFVPFPEIGYCGCPPVVVAAERTVVSVWVELTVKVLVAVWVVAPAPA
jgi:hypothetical protein